jgi:hydroxymethylpyrimidine pyrophosphatase-like HAD family hydrolase
VKMRAIICDMDGCLANHDRRVPYLQQEPRDWEGFYKDQINDPVNEACAIFIRAISNAGIWTIFLTGRPEKYRETTLQYIGKAFDDDGDPIIGSLYMRADDDTMRPADFKKKLYLEKLKDEFDILFAIDDLEEVCQAYKSVGLPCFRYDNGTGTHKTLQIAEGEK